MKRISWGVATIMLAVVLVGCATAQRGTMIQARAELDAGGYKEALAKLADAEKLVAPTLFSFPPLADDIHDILGRYSRFDGGNVQRGGRAFFGHQRKNAAVLSSNQHFSRALGLVENHGEFLTGF
jgi:hypothetical protein